MPGLLLPPDLIPEGKSFCNVPDAELLEANSQLAQWPAGTALTFGIVQVVRGFTMLDMARIGEEAYREWHEACGLPPIKWTQDLTSAHILIGIRNIDGVYGVLAEAELPVGNVTADRQLRLWFDNRDTYVDSLNPPSGRIPILPVWRHEGGHTLGLGHNMNNVKDALMDPALSDIIDLQAWDIAQIQMRYGKPELTPPTPPLPPLPSDWEAMAQQLERVARWIRDHAPH